jgi:hypothetical protein
LLSRVFPSVHIPDGYRLRTSRLGSRLRLGFMHVRVRDRVRVRVRVRDRVKVMIRAGG